MTERIEIEISRRDHRRRLEDVLCDQFIGLSKMYLRDVIKDEKCEVNGRFENRGYLVRSNDFLEIELDLSRKTAMMPEDIPLDIIFEDSQVIVVNKPCGMLAHPTHKDKSGTLLNALTFYLNKERNEEKWRAGGQEAIMKKDRLSPSPILPVSPSAFVRPGLIHRLDKDTSGLTLVAKTPRAHRILSRHFERRLVAKRYLALVEGVVAENEGVISAPIGRFAELKYWDVKADGKCSATRFIVKKRFSDTTIVELEPLTGRTNQLRIHCAFIGHPIVGDVERGGREFSRLCLHASKLSFWHPDGGERVNLEACISFASE